MNFSAGMRHLGRLVVVFATLIVIPLKADPTLPALFSDHAVLQKSTRVPIWGHAGPGEAISLRLAEEGPAAGPFMRSAQTTADSQGAWKATLDLTGAPDGALVLEVKGRTTVAAHDLRAGEVWICSGQSNMDWSVARTSHAASTIAQSANPQLRVFTPVRQTSPRPLDDLKGAWQVAGPAAAGGFPAVGYFFGRDVQAALGGNVGLVHISWGGSPVEAWTSAEALATDPDLQEGSALVKTQVENFPAKVGRYLDALRAWEQKYARQLPPPADPKAFTDPGASTEGWKPVELPGPLAAAGLPDAGVIWLRRTFTLTPEMEVGPLFINLGVLRDFDSAYINGIKVGETTPQSGGADSARTYYAEVNQFKAGPVTVAIRLVAPAGGAAIEATKAGFNIDTASLSGTWLAKVEAPLPALDAAARAEYPHPMALGTYIFRTPTYLFNGMVNPVIPFAMRGAVWYQGEDNAPRARQYRKAFPLMIEDWRKRWGEGAFPFYFCQLTSFGPVVAQPEESAWAELRDAQTATLSLPNTGEAILIDIGEPGDIHPRDKMLVGDRLARLALKRTYGRPVVDAGPFYDHADVVPGAVLVHFTHADGGLAAHPLPARYRPMTVSAETLPLVLPAPDSALQGFAICGSDRKWVWAEAAIAGPDSVRVHSPQVPNPVAVRYAWASSPICNLFNGAGLPAAPFRTDDFPGTTDKTRYGFEP